MAGRVDRLHHAGFGLEFSGGLKVPTFSGECVAGLTKSNPHISYLFFHNGWSILTLHLENDFMESQDNLPQEPQPLVEMSVALDLSRWIGKAYDDGLSRDQALSELRGRAVPWQAEAINQPQ